ncbi:phosducin-like protein [Ornithodoros turicata]|uniref:phosducin-like protein n=1 Tax=Ornithodoros turicata TaxID=34597 RepID=UPI003138C883
MATLEDRILGEKLQYYCSSSESEDESSGKGKEDPEDKRPSSLRSSRSPARPEIREWEGSSVNTGPKGVLKDWQRFKQLENEKREQQERERLQLIKKLSLTCKSDRDAEREKEEDVDKDLQEVLEDDFLKEYMRKRMEEMMTKTIAKPKFGKLLRLKDGQEFLDAVDKEKKGVTVITHIYADGIQGCEAMNGCLQCLAEEYPQVKFCVVEASSAGMSRHFERSGVPALLVYKDGSLIGNFVRLTDEFGEDFFAVDVESFLIEHGFLPDPSLVPSLAISQAAPDNDDDSDFGVD